MTPEAGRAGAEELWAAYLDAVERAARAVARQAVEHGLPVLTRPSPPDIPWPAALEPRRREVLKALEAAQATVRGCRDRTAAVLATLPRSWRVRGGYADGERLDVVG